MIHEINFDSRQLKCNIITSNRLIEISHLGMYQYAAMTHCCWFLLRTPDKRLGLLIKTAQNRLTSIANVEDISLELSE